MIGRTFTLALAFLLTAGVSLKADTLKLKCEMVDNIDPSPNRFQFRVTNLGAVSKASITKTVPIGADIKIRVSPGYPNDIHYKLSKALAPGEDVDFPRKPRGKSCSAIATW